MERSARGSKLYALECRTAPGVGHSLRFAVSVASHDSAPSADAFSYLPPVVEGIGGPGAFGAVTPGVAADRHIRQGIRSAWCRDRFCALRRESPARPYQAGWRYGRLVRTVRGEELQDCRRAHADPLRDGRRVGQRAPVASPDWRPTLSGAQGTGAHAAGRCPMTAERGCPFNAGTSYASPVILDFFRPSMKEDEAATSRFETVGNQSILIIGKDFGPAATDRRSDDTIKFTRYDHSVGAYSKWEGLVFNASGCFVLESHVKMLCATPEGAGRLLSWDVEVDGQRSVHASTVLRRASRPWSGWRSQPIDARWGCIHGERQELGRVGSVRGEAAAAAAAQRPRWGRTCPTRPAKLSRRAHVRADVERALRATALSARATSRLCARRKGCGKGLLLQITVGGQTLWPDLNDETRYLNATASCAPPRLFAIAPRNGTTHGGYELVILGAHLGVFLDDLLRRRARGAVASPTRRATTGCAFGRAARARGRSGGCRPAVKRDGARAVLRTACCTRTGPR